jgi:hypothetical protein
MVKDTEKPHGKENSSNEITVPEFFKILKKVSKKIPKKSTKKKK